MLLVADLLAAHLSYGGDPSGPLNAWDGHFYLQIALHGYPSATAAHAAHFSYSVSGFEPVFPALIRFVAVLTRLSVDASALVVSILGGAAATVLVWLLAFELRGEEVAYKAALLFVVFPGMGVAWGVYYSESVGLALAAASLLLMARERWLWAGLVGAAATATSPLALPLVLAPAVPAIKALRERRLRVASVRVATVVMTPLGFLAFAGWLAVRYDDALYWWHLQHRAWGATVDFGKSLVLLLPHFWSGGYQGRAWLEWIGIVAVGAAVFSLWRARLPALVNAYCAGVFVLLLVSNQLGFKPRLLVWAFPALVAVASFATKRLVNALAVTFAALLPIVFLAYATLGNTMIQP